MSHSAERKEKICLNCYATIYGRYCHVCGQENIEPKETFWGLVTHFVYDITHFDGKFFSTLKYLLFKPGFLSHEYVKGKRASYLNPVRMYVFTSAFFFLIFFSFIGSREEKANENFKAETLQKRTLLQKQLLNAKDSLQIKQSNDQIEALNKVLNIYDDTGMIMDTSDIKEAKVTPALFGDSLPENIAQYDSLQKKLSAPKKDGWFVRFFKKRVIQINTKYHGNSKEFIKNFGEKFLHAFPQIMFISLPLVALLLKLLYVRHKSIYYVNHLIFTVHTYIAIYILILFTYLFNYINSVSGWRMFNWLETITVFLIFFYIYKALRNFYRQRRARTIVKFLLLNFVYIFILIILIVVFGITTFLQV